MKKINKQLNKVQNKEELKWYSLDQVLEKASRSEKFKRAYNEELTRIRLAKKVRDSRLAKKMTQGDVAAKAEMPQSVVARLESGQHSVSLDTLNKVAYALGKKIELV